MAAGGGNGHDAAHIVLAEICPLENEHAAEGTTDDGGNLLDAKLVEKKLVKAGVGPSVSENRTGTGKERGHSPHIVSDGCQGELRAIPSLGRVTIHSGDGAGSAIGAPKAVHADDEEARSIEGASGTSEKRTPPVSDVGAAGESVADHHDIVARRGKCAAGCVCDGHIIKGHARLEGEGWDNGDLLVGDESSEGVLGLGGDSPWKGRVSVSQRRFTGQKRRAGRKDVL
jgi:hypothetical protein